MSAVVRSEPITVLTSGVALGAHVPGVVLVRRLREAGVTADIHVLEGLLPDAGQARIPALRAAFHRDHRAVRAAQGLARDPLPLLDPARLGALLDRWRAEERRRFVALSGFWVPVLGRHAELVGDDIDVDLCHLDAALSPSFARCLPRTRRDASRTLHQNGPHGATSARSSYRDVWLLDGERGTLVQTIPITRDPPIPWSQRPARYVAHGGGWGIGPYRDRARALATRGLGVDVVAYAASDIDPTWPSCRWFLLDPTWHPWHDDDGFPPLTEIDISRSPRSRRTMAADPGHRSGIAPGTRENRVFDLVRRAQAVVSKPGGGTLLDSLAAATPVVLLDPVGEHEARNAELWCRLGFGLPYDDWWDDGCPPAALEELHQNLVRARAVPSYAQALAQGR